MPYVPKETRILLKLADTGEGWADRIKSQIKHWAASGMSSTVIEERLLATCSPGGAIFEAIMNSFRNSAGELVDFVTIEEAHNRWEGTDSWIWITVDDDNRCDDCADRDGEVHTWKEWENMGLPGMGTTACGWRCRCSLEPSEVAAEGDL